MILFDIKSLKGKKLIVNFGDGTWKYPYQLSDTDNPNFFFTEWVDESMTDFQIDDYVKPVVSPVECTHINLYVWSDGTFCEDRDLNEYLIFMSDDYEVMKFPLELGLDSLEDWVLYYLGS